MDTSGTHPVVGVVGNALRDSAGRLGVGENLIAFFDERECEEGSANLSSKSLVDGHEELGIYGTYVGGDAANDKLLLASSPNGIAEVRVVPGIDLTVALDERRVGVHVGDFLRQGSIRPWQCQSKSVKQASHTTIAYQSRRWWS